MTVVSVEKMEAPRRQPSSWDMDLPWLFSPPTSKMPWPLYTTLEEWKGCRPTLSISLASMETMILFSSPSSQKLVRISWPFS